jgi:hypothetical protein
MPTAWEYIEQPVPLGQIAAEGNKLGALGWELIECLGPMQIQFKKSALEVTGDVCVGVVLVMKRPHVGTALAMDRQGFLEATQTQITPGAA